MQYVGAYVVRGGEGALESLVDKLEKDKITKRGSPDLFARVYRKFGVDEAEELRSRARSKPIAGDQRVFALFIPSMTTEAQNALLKTLEEPAANAVFFLVVPSPEMLLATVRSRVQTLVVPEDMSRRHVDTIDADDFLAASAEKRLTMLKPLYDHDEDEGRDIGSVIAFLQSLERRFARLPEFGGQAKEKPSPATSAGIHAIYRARKYVTDKGSLLKALLEQVALLAPKL